MGVKDITDTNEVIYSYNLSLQGKSDAVNNEWVRNCYFKAICAKRELSIHILINVLVLISLS